MFLDRLDTQAATTILEHLEASDAAMRAAQLRVLGGAIARVPDDATAYAHRQRPIMVSTWPPSTRAPTTGPAASNGWSGSPPP
jgi:hypothetical protein